MTQGVPGLIWSVLIIFASALIGCMLVFAAEASISKAVLVGVFTSSLTLALLTVHVLDFPFESALQLPSRDFNETLKRVDDLAAAQPHSSRASEYPAVLQVGFSSRFPNPARQCKLPYDFR